MFQNTHIHTLLIVLFIHTAFAVVLDSNVLQLVAGRLVQLTDVVVVHAVTAAHGLAAQVVAVAVALGGTLTPGCLAIHAGLALGAIVAHLALARVSLTYRIFIAR